MDKALPLDGIPESPHATEFTGVHADIQTQLSNPGDVSAATNFFKPSGGEAYLPNMATSTAVGPTGMEAAALAPPPGLEAGLGMPLTPGAEQMSPLINMIMKMPGHIGLASSFFEFLGSMFGGGDLTSMIDPGMGGDLLGGALDGAGEHLGIDLSLLPDDAPGLELADATTSFEPLTNNNPLNYNSSEWLDGPGPSLDDSFRSSPDLDVGGGASPGKPLFEHTAADLNFAPSGSSGQNDFLAMDPGGGFGSTIGPASTPQSIPLYNNLQQAAQPGQEFARDGGSGAESQFGQPSADGQSHDVAQGDGAQPQTPDSAETTSYTVKEGDNLWDLAGKHMGDSTRWGEIYKLNEGVIGNNPRLIMPGTELQMPAGADNLASAGDYTVKPGDNLWDISKDHLGGGEHWKDLYSQNVDVVGQNPDLIHPGQRLQMSGAEHAGGSHLASSHNLNSTAHGAHSASGSHMANAHSGGAHAANAHASSVHHGADHSVAHAANPAHTNAGHSSGEIAAKPAKLADISQAQAAPVEMKAQAQSLSGVPGYEEASGAFDMSTKVPN